MLWKEEKVVKVGYNSLVSNDHWLNHVNNDENKEKQLYLTKQIQDFLYKP